MDLMSIRTTAKMRALGAAVCLTGLSFTFCTAAYAASYTQSAMKTEMEEVVVTAQKREQNLADVPASVKAISEQKMQSLGMTDSFDLADHTAGLTIAGTNRQSKPQIFIRGVGNSDYQTGSISPVASYANGVYQGANFSLASSLIDLERVEVLKGPQGTLWGRNTTAGLINYVPNVTRPGDEATGRVEASYDDQGELNLDFAAGMSFSDTFAGRLAMNFNDRDGVFKSVGPYRANDYGGGQSYAIRGNLIIEPSDEFSISLTAAVTDYDAMMNPTKSLGLTNPGFVTPCSKPGELGTDCASLNLNPFGANFVSSADTHTVEHQFKSFEEISSESIALQIDYDMASDLQLTSVTAFLSSDRRSFDDTDGTPEDTLETSYDDDYESFSQEIRLTSDYDGEFNWILGAYYYTDDLRFYSAAPFMAFPGVTGKSQKVSTNTSALFGEVNWDLSERLTLAVGLRWTYDKREADGDIFSFNYNLNEYADLDFARNNRTTTYVNQTISTTSREPSGRISLMYLLTDEINLWAAVGRGFKGGDSNSGADSPASFTITEPEYLTSYEIGLKGSIFDSFLQFDVAAYFYDYEDKQVFTEVVTPTGNIVTLSNAGQLSIQGIDASATWFISDRLFIDAGLAYIDSEFDEFRTGALGNLKGNTTAYTPELSFNFIAGYSWDLADNGSLSVQVDGVWTDDQFFTNNNSPNVMQESLWLWGGSVTFASPDDNYEVALWARNLTDEDYLIGSFEFVGNVIAYPGDPRAVGLTASYSF